MKTIEEKAKAYATERMIAYADDDIFSTRVIQENHIHDECRDAYLAGAKEILAGQWKDPKKELPEKGAECLIVFKSAPQFKYVVDFDGDVFIGNGGVANSVWRWMPITEPPKDENE